MSRKRDSSYRIIDHFNKNDSTIHLVYNVEEKQKTKYFLKAIDLEKLGNLTEFIQDILWYKQLNHSNLMSLRDCFLFDTKLYLVKPFALFGSCTDLLARYPFGISEQLIALIVWQVIQALFYLHERHILHRAVASQNIFICEDGRVLLDNFSSCISMISPFDGKLRRQLHEYTDKLQKQIPYLAPEVIYQNTTGYNFKSDVYSLGMVACELANGSHTYVGMPFGHLSMLYAKVQGSEPILLDQSQLTAEMIALTDENCSAYVEEIKKRRYSKDFHAFIKSCVATQLEMRCSIDDLQGHPFFKSVKKIAADPQALAGEVTKILGSSVSSEKKSMNEMKIDQLFENNGRSIGSINAGWEF